MNQPDQPTSQHRVLRIIDANLNRTAEALRVIEDGLRFVVEDRHLSRVCKGLRHELKRVAEAWPNAALLAMRAASADVGRHTDVQTEYQRSSTADVLHANFARASQSLRVLEEYAKTGDVSAAQQVEHLRYEVYDLEKAVVGTLASQLRMADVQLYVLVDGRESETAFAQLVEQLVDAGVDAIQLRDRKLTDRELTTRAERLVELTRPRRVLSIVNDRTDVAIAARADAVHLGQDDLDVSAARQMAGPNLLVGISTHSLEQARQARLDGADYIGVGPVFKSGTKTFVSFVGPELLRQVAAEILLPAFAIGGITLDNVDQVTATGFARVAVSAGVLEDATRIQERVQSFKMALASRRSPV